MIDLNKPICDKAGCQNRATAFGQGFENGQSAAMRCEDHPWTVVELQKMVKSHIRTQRALACLPQAAREALANAESAEEYRMLFEGFFNTDEIA